MRLEIACSLRARLRGLYGRESLDGVLVLAPCNDVHTLGMKGSVDVAFVAADGNVLASHKNVGPNRRLRNRRAAITLERYSNGTDWYEVGDVVQLGVLRE